LLLLLGDATNHTQSTLLPPLYYYHHFTTTAAATAAAANPIHEYHTCSSSGKLLQALPSQPLGQGTSRYYPSYLNVEEEHALLNFCKEKVIFQYYLANQRPNGNQWRYIAPKAEFYVCQSDGRRPIYKWTQAVEFFQAGYEMPAILVTTMNRLNNEFTLVGEKRLNHAMIIINEQTSDHCEAHKEPHKAPSHVDKHRTGTFFDLSLGYAREFQLISRANALKWRKAQEYTKVDQKRVHISKGGNKIESLALENALKTKKASSLEEWEAFGVDAVRLRQGDFVKSGSAFFKVGVGEVVACQRLASGSLAYVSAEDNGHGHEHSGKKVGNYSHAVPPDFSQPKDEPRFSIVFRAITEHPTGNQAAEHFAQVDRTAAARLRPGGDLWNPYFPLFNVRCV